MTMITNFVAMLMYKEKFTCIESLYFFKQAIRSRNGSFYVLIFPFASSVSYMNMLEKRNVISRWMLFGCQEVTRMSLHCNELNILIALTSLPIL